MVDDSWTHAAFQTQYLEAEGLLFSRAATLTECDLIVQMLGLRAGSAVLDLACGHGRHTLELVSRGYGPFTGLDYSPEALDYATRAAQEQSHQVAWVQGDMRALEFSEQFDAVINAYNSLFYWDDATHLQILRGIHRALRPGGLLWLDVYNREFMAARSFLEEHPRFGVLMRARLELSKLRSRVRNALKADQVTFVKSIERRFDPLTGVMHGVKRITFSDGRGFADPFAVRLYSYTELTALLKRAGFEPLDVRSCPDGGPYRLGSVRLALVARKV